MRIKTGRNAIQEYPLLCSVLLLVLLSIPAYSAEPIYIVALGASQTEGKIVPRKDAYPAQLEGLLRAEGLNVRVVNQGVSGATTSDMRSRLKKAVPIGTQIVLFQPGTNDCGRRPNPEGTFVDNMRYILSWFKERHLSVLVLGGNCYENVQASMPAEYGFTYYGLINQGLEAFSRPDGQHYIADGYSRMAQLLAPHVKAMIAALK